MRKRVVSLLLVIGLLFGTTGTASAKQTDPDQEDSTVYTDTTEIISEPESEPETPEPFTQPEEQSYSLRDRFLNFLWDTEEGLAEGFRAMFEGIIMLPESLLTAAGWLLLALALPFMLIGFSIAGKI